MYKVFIKQNLKFESLTNFKPKSSYEYGTVQ